MNYIIKRFFSLKAENLLNKIKKKKTVADVKKLNSFLNNTVKDNKIVSKINKTAILDEEFKTFLNDFKNKNKNYPDIIDLSRFNSESENYEENAKNLKDDEKEILKEFEKRNNEKKLFESNMNENEQLNFENFNEKFMNENFGSQINNEMLLTTSEFAYIILEKKTTTNVTRLNRVNTMHTLVFCGNGDGIIGYGKGRGIDFEVSLKNAMKNCDKNLITINYDFLNSFVQDHRKKFMSVTMSMYRRKHFSAWGNPIVGHMIQLAGITSLGFKLIYRKPKYLPITYLFFYIMTQNKTPKDLAELYGCKIQDLGFARQTKAWDRNYLKL